MKNQPHFDRSPFLSGSVLADCTLCPRSCHVNRLAGERGFCGETGVLRAARAALYYNEEPVISGHRGSGTVFFAGCSLGCIYCQNRQISRPAQSAGAAPSPSILELSPERLCEIFLELQDQGAHNINLVTPEHFVPRIIPALDAAKKRGLSIPVVYNTGSYERVDSVKALEGLVDVWMPDLKYFSPVLSRRHLGVSDYFRYASAAIAEMVRQCPEPVFSDGSHEIDCPDDADDPLMLRGVLVRHLALPGCAEDSRAVLRYLHETYGDHIFISLMNQYTPMPQVLRKKKPVPWQEKGTGSQTLPSSADAAQAFDPNLFRRLSAEEYDALVDYAIELGITNGFIQEGGTVSPSYIPAFDGTGIPGPLTPSSPGTSYNHAP